MSIPKIWKADDYTHFPTDSNPTTIEEYVEYVKNQYAVLAALTGCILWQPSTAYKVGQVVVSPGMVAGTSGVVTTAGATSTVEPDWTGIGTTVTDNSVSYIIVPLARQTVSQAEAVAGTDDVKTMTALKTFYAAAQVITNTLATQTEAQAGTNNAKIMTPLRVAQAITALAATSTIVRTSGDQAIYGTKSFGSTIIANISGSAGYASSAGNCDTVDGYHAANLISSATSIAACSHGTNGYIKFTTGTLIQWGVCGCGGSTGFPVSFSGTNYGLALTPNTGDSTGYQNTRITGRAAGSFSTAGNGWSSATWVAAGY